MEDCTPVDKTAAVPVVVGISAIGKCVLWTGYVGPNGYGQRSFNGRKVYAHRQAWADVHGDPGSWHVLHRCDVRACVNVAHLFLGTNADNVADMVAKGRQSRVRAKGQQHGSAKLTDDQVREIRASTELLRVIASRYGVTDVAVSCIRLRKTWKHLP